MHVCFEIPVSCLNHFRAGGYFQVVLENMAILSRGRLLLRCNYFRDFSVTQLVSPCIFREHLGLLDPLDSSLDCPSVDDPVQQLFFKVCRETLRNMYLIDS